MAETALAARGGPSTLWPASSAAHPDWFGGGADVGGGGLNLSTIPVAAQKYANDCIDASARIILSHSGVNMSEDQLEERYRPRWHHRLSGCRFEPAEPGRRVRAYGGVRRKPAGHVRGDQSVH